MSSVEDLNSPPHPNEFSLFHMVVESNKKSWFWRQTTQGTKGEAKRWMERRTAGQVEGELEIGGITDRKVNKQMEEWKNQQGNGNRGMETGEWK